MTEGRNTEKTVLDRPWITIRFGKGLVKNFTSKDGRELSEIRIPNRDPEDRRPWESFALPAKFVKDNRFGKGVWIRLPMDGSTNLMRSVSEETAEGRTWHSETRTVSNMELKGMLENYRSNDRESAAGNARGAVKEAAGPAEEGARARENRQAARMINDGKKKAAQPAR